MRNIKGLFVVAVLLLTSSINAFAWNKPGHMVTGAFGLHQVSLRSLLCVPITPRRSERRERC
jgi:hypothetical protein